MIGLRVAVLGAALAITLSACMASQSNNTSGLDGGFTPDVDPTHGTAVSWHRGNMDQAFAIAKQKRQPVLLYWGAVWCPPCNELKAEVFSRPEFKELMADAVPVYLDGDSDYAQSWGELFQISGYPTILILDYERQELMRVAEALSMEEFAQAFRSAVQSSRPFNATLEKAIAGTASEEDWRLLAYFAWYGARGIDVFDPTVLAKRQQLADSVPQAMVAERALLSARLLEAAAAEGTPASAAKDKIKTNAGRYITAMMVDDGSRFAARTTLITGHNGILDWAYHSDSANRKLMSDKWTVAVTRLRADTRLSNDQRLWTWYPEIQAATLRAGADGRLPAALVANVRTAVAAADAAAKTAFERQSVISGAAYLLRKVGEFDAAATMLLAEAQRSKSPYYYYSSLATLEKERNNNTKALEYAKKASDLAQGRSTKLQWLVTDMGMTAQFADADKRERLRDLAEQYYNLLFAVKDGFAGRSYRSTKRVGEILAGVDIPQKFRAELRNYATRCTRLDEVSKVRCQDHFASLLTPKAQVRGKQPN